MLVKLWVGVGGCRVLALSDQAEEESQPRVPHQTLDPGLVSTFPRLLAYLPLLVEFESSQSHLLHPDPRPAAITGLCSCPKQAKILGKSYGIKDGALTLRITPLSCPEPSSVPPQALAHTNSLHLAFTCKPQKLAYAN